MKKILCGDGRVFLYHGFQAMGQGMIRTVPIDRYVFRLSCTVSAPAEG